MKKEEFDNVVLKEKEKRLSISRLPKRVKEEFIEYANEEFCSDYGACLHSVWDNFKLWKMYFENIDMKLDIIINKFEKPNVKPDDKEEITLLSGKIIKKEVENSNGNTK